MQKYLGISLYEFIRDQINKYSWPLEIEEDDLIKILDLVTKVFNNEITQEEMTEFWDLIIKNTDLESDFMQKFCLRKNFRCNKRVTQYSFKKSDDNCYTFISEMYNNNFRNLFEIRSNYISFYILWNDAFVSVHIGYEIKKYENQMMATLTQNLALEYFNIYQMKFGYEEPYLMT